MVEEGRHHPPAVENDQPVAERQQFAEKLAKTSRECREMFLMSCAAENQNRRLRLSALGVIMAPPDDRRYRTVYEDSIALRNRLFGN